MSGHVGTGWDTLVGVRQDGTGLRHVRTKEIGYPFPATPGYSLVIFN